MEFKVTWEVRYYDSEPEKVYLTEELIEHDDLDSLMDYLRKNAIEHTPEMDVPYETGDFNIDWVMIHDANTSKELWRNSDYNWELMDEERKKKEEQERTGIG